MRKRVVAGKEFGELAEGSQPVSDTDVYHVVAPVLYGLNRKWTIWGSELWFQDSRISPSVPI